MTQNPYASGKPIPAPLCAHRFSTPTCTRDSEPVPEPRWGCSSPPPQDTHVVSAPTCPEPVPVSMTQNPYARGKPIPAQVYVHRFSTPTCIPVTQNLYPNPGSAHRSVPIALLHRLPVPYPHCTRPYPWRGPTSLLTTLRWVRWSSKDIVCEIKVVKQKKRGNKKTQVS